MEPREQEEIVSAAIDCFSEVPGGLMPLLHAVQDRLGFIPPSAVPEIARRLRLSRAEVHGVISFYHDFRSAPGGRHTLGLCRAEACQAVGARDLERCAQEQLGIEFGQTTADGRLTLEPVYCLGNCACGPSVRIDDTVHARVDGERLAQLLDELGVERKT